MKIDEKMLQIDNKQMIRSVPDGVLEIVLQVFLVNFIVNFKGEVDY